MMYYFDNNTTEITAEIAEVLKSHPESIAELDLELNESIAFVREAAKINRDILMYLPEYIRNNEYAMLSLISIFPEAAACCGEIKFSRSFMFRAIEVNPACYVFAPDWVKSDSKLSADACSRRRDLFKYIAPGLMYSLDFAKECISRNYKMYASLLRLRSFTDEERATLLIHESRLAGYMTDLINNRENAMSLAAANPFLARCIPDDFRKDKAFASELLEKNGLALKFLDDDIKNDPTLVKKAMKNEPMSFIAASDALKDNKAFVREAVAIDPIVLKYTNKFKNDREIVTEAVKADPRAVKYIGSSLNYDNEFMAELTCEYPMSARYSGFSPLPGEHFSYCA